MARAMIQKSKSTLLVDVKRERRDPEIRDGLLFGLVLASNLAARPFIESIGTREGLNLSEWRCLIVLAADPGLSGEDVARATGLDKMTVSRSLRALEDTGRTERSSDPRDLKRNLWRMTTAGWIVFNRVAKSAHARQARILSTMSKADQRELRRLLGNLVSCLNEPDAQDPG